MKRQTIIYTNALRLDDELTIAHIKWDDEKALNIWNVETRDLTRGRPMLSYEIGLLFPRILQAFEPDYDADRRDAPADEISFFDVADTRHKRYAKRVAYLDGYTITIEQVYDEAAFPLSEFVGYRWTIGYASTRKMLTGTTSTLEAAETESAVLLNAALDKYAAA